MNDKSENANAVMQSEGGRSVAESKDRFDVYDPYILEKAKVQLMYGDWHELAALSDKIIEGSADKAELTLLKASGLFQLGQANQAKEYLSDAEALGADKRRIKQVIISGAYNSLALAAAIAGREDITQTFFEIAIETIVGYKDPYLLTQGRMMFQMRELEDNGFSEHSKRLPRTEDEKNIEEPGHEPGSLLDEGALIKTMVSDCLVNTYLQIGNDVASILHELPCTVVCVSPFPKAEEHPVGVKVVRETIEQFCSLSAREHLGEPPDLIASYTKPLIELALRDIHEIAKIASAETILLIPGIYPEQPDAEWQSNIDKGRDGGLWQLPSLLRRYFPELKLQEYDTKQSGVLAIRNLNAYKNGVCSEALSQLLREAQAQSIPDEVVARRERAIRYTENTLVSFIER